MKILNTNLKSILCLVVACLSLCEFSLAQDATESPHWNANTCDACHNGGQPTIGNLSLRHESTEALCESCHGDQGSALACRHSSDLLSDSVSVPEGLAGNLQNGKVVCSTCHDVVYQCERPRISYSFQNRGFLRDRTSRKASDYCSKCHDTDAYQKLNPHTGVTGSPPRPSCQLCHSDVPEANADGKLVVKFNAKHDLNDACKGCHNVRPHPKSMSFGTSTSTEEWVHLVRPSDSIREKMRNAQAISGIGLPLSPENGEVFCATCHNPHDFKVGGEHGSQSREVKHRLRQANICQACHEK